MHQQNPGPAGADSRRAEPVEPESREDREELQTRGLQALNAELKQMNCSCAITCQPCGTAASGEHEPAPNVVTIQGRQAVRHAGPHCSSLVAHEPPRCNKACQCKTRHPARIARSPRRLPQRRYALRALRCARQPVVTPNTDGSSPSHRRRCQETAEAQTSGDVAAAYVYPSHAALHPGTQDQDCSPFVWCRCSSVSSVSCKDEQSW